MFAARVKHRESRGTIFARDPIPGMCVDPAYGRGGNNGSCVRARVRAAEFRVATTALPRAPNVLFAAAATAISATRKRRTAAVGGGHGGGGGGGSKGSSLIREQQLASNAFSVSSSVAAPPVRYAYTGARVFRACPVKQ